MPEEFSSLSSKGEEGQPVYLGVQICRGIAALLVLLYHNSQQMETRAFDARLIFSAGASGVDIFFAISGFVMVLVTADSWGRTGVAMPFLVRRLVRVVPLYWICTLSKILLMLLMPSLIINTVLTPWHVVSSLLFVPSNFRAPILEVGWTLSYEMLFYFLFTFLLFIRVQPVVWLSVILAILALAGFYRTDSWWPPTQLMNPLLIEFILGMLIGLAATKRRFLPPRIAVATASASIVALMLSNSFGAVVEPFRLLFWGVPGAMLLASVVALEGEIRKCPIKWPVRLGAASYSIYLIHTVVVGGVWVVADKANLAHGFSSYVIYVIASFVCIVAAWFVHTLVELPLSRFFGRHSTRKTQTLPIVQTVQ